MFAAASTVEVFGVALSAYAGEPAPDPRDRTSLAVDGWARAREVFQAKCAALAHCKHGHSLADAYVYNGRRKCRCCTRIRAKCWEAKQRAKAR
jgi:hypothetical protein